MVAKVSSSRGALLVIVAAATFAILALLILAFNITLWGDMRTQIQVAAESAAHAGASVMCSSKSCWAEAKDAARLALSKSRINRGLLGAFQIELDPDAGPEWITEHATVKIYRGAWWPSGALEGQGLPEENRFQPFETSAMTAAVWQAANPGIPNFAAMNAIYVQVEVKNAGLFSLFGALSSVRFESSAIATAGRVNSVPVAPFAIPICALLADSGDYKVSLDRSKYDPPDLACKYDRFFANSDRYCPGGADCDVLPGFVFNAMPDPVTWGSCSEEMVKNGSCLYGGSEGTSCTFGQPRMTSAFNHYGYVGLPGNSPVNEGDVLARLNNGDGLIEAAIGDGFTVLGAGLTLPETDAAIWSRISKPVTSTLAGGASMADPNWPSAYSCSGCTPQNPLYIHTDLRGAIKQNLRSGCSAEELDNSYPSWGRCNSKWASWGPDILSYFGQCPGCACETSGGSQYHSALNTMNHTVWVAPVAVIADPAGACKGFLSSVTNPHISGGGTYRIIGFVKVALYDVDIGSPALDPQNMFMWGDHTATHPECTYDPAPYHGNYGGRTICPCEGFSTPYVTDKLPNMTRIRVANGEITPTWQFVPPGRTIGDACNLVRGMVTCDSTLIPTSDQFERHSPSLVR